MTGTILSIVVLILIFEKLFLKIKLFEPESHPKAVISSETEIVD